MENLERVQNFIQHFWGIKDKRKLTLDKSLSDLGFYGDDKLEFMKKFFLDFQINSVNFVTDEFIEPESNFLSPMNLFYAMFRKNKIRKDYKRITIEDLVLTIDKKKWT